MAAYKGDKIISSIHVGGREITAGYQGSRQVFGASNSVFGLGAWNNDNPWNNDDSWRNDV